MTHLCDTYIVDDNAGVCGGLKFLLGALGVHSVGYATSDDFVTASVGLGPGCVLLDMTMPAGGIRVLRHMQGLPQRFGVIAMSGSRDEALCSLASTLGAIRWLEKPFSEDDLTEALEAAWEHIKRGSLPG